MIAARLGAALASGVIFGLGLAISEMVNPAKVLAFLDVAGDWDPSLILVMAGAVAVALAAFRLILKQPRPALADSFALPTKTRIDGRLLGGAALFGLGWGLVGLCPGPAIGGLAYLMPESLYFLAAMAVGMVIAALLKGAGDGRR